MTVEEVTGALRGGVKEPIAVSIVGVKISGGTGKNRDTEKSRVAGKEVRADNNRRA